MKENKKIIGQIIDTAKKNRSTPQDIILILQKLSQMVKNFSKEELNWASLELIRAIPRLNHLKAAIICSSAGMCIENGGDPRIIFDGLISRTEEMLSDGYNLISTAVLLAKAQKKQPQQLMGELALKDPKGGMALQTMGMITAPVAAVLSRSKELRDDIKKKKQLLELFNQLAPMNPQVEYMRKISNVLDDEEFLVLHPKEQKGYRVKITGIASNHQLQVLLEDQIIGDPNNGFVTGTRQPPEIVKLFIDQNSTRKQSIQENFQLFNWSALQDDGTLPEGLGMTLKFQNEFIWGEGIPLDIESIENLRIILLGNTSIRRSLGANRLFLGMDANLELIEILNPDQVNKWIDYILSNKKKL
jgi:hypothetical protein